MEKREKKIERIKNTTMKEKIDTNKHQLQIGVETKGDFHTSEGRIALFIKIISFRRRHLNVFVSKMYLETIKRFQEIFICKN